MITEEAARAQLASAYPASVVGVIDRYVSLLVEENGRQNLIASSTIASIWARHILDSVQLVDLVAHGWRHWVDVGSGAGLPGIVVAIISGQPVTLIEPRRLRTDFLTRCSLKLNLPNVSVVQGKAGTVTISAADVISARAVAKLDEIFKMTRGFATPATTYVLPKGEGASSEVSHTRRKWQGTFHVKQSIVDPSSGIVVATKVSPR